MPGLRQLLRVLRHRDFRHWVMVATDLVRFTLHALLAILIVAGAVRIWHVAVIGMLFGTAEAFFRPAASGLLPQTVPDVWWLTALAERIPPDRLSRVTSYDWMVSLALLPLGYVLAGPAADAIGAANVLLGGAALAFVALALGLLPRETRMLERRDDGAAPFALANPHPPVPVP